MGWILGENLAVSGSGVWGSCPWASWIHGFMGFHGVHGGVRAWGSWGCPPCLGSWVVELGAKSEGFRREHDIFAMKDHGDHVWIIICWFYMLGCGSKGLTVKPESKVKETNGGRPITAKERWQLY